MAILKTVRQFESKVALQFGQREADASDVLAVLALGVPQGAELILLAEGFDANAVLDALLKLFADNFGMGKE